jgi:hypothetical protein
VREIPPEIGRAGHGMPLAPTLSQARCLSRKEENRPMDEQAKNTKEMKAVYTVIDRGQGKSFWVRVGVGFTNRDGSLNLRLDAIPVNGSLQVRDWSEPPTDRRSEGLDPVRPRSRSRDASSDAVIEG